MPLDRFAICDGTLAEDLSLPCTSFDGVCLLVVCKGVHVDIHGDPDDDNLLVGKLARVALSIPWGPSTSCLCHWQVRAPALLPPHSCFQTPPYHQWARVRTIGLDQRSLRARPASPGCSSWRSWTSASPLLPWPMWRVDPWLPSPLSRPPRWQESGLSWKKPLQVCHWTAKSPPQPHGCQDDSTSLLRGSGLVRARNSRCTKSHPG